MWSLKISHNIESCNHIEYDYNFFFEKVKVNFSPNNF